MKKHFWTVAFLFCLMGPEAKAYPGLLEQDASRLEARMSSRNTQQMAEKKEDVPPTFQSRVGKLCRQAGENFVGNLKYIGKVACWAAAGLGAYAAPSPLCGEAFVELCMFEEMGILTAEEYHSSRPYQNVTEMMNYCIGLYNAADSEQAALDSLRAARMR